MRPRRFRRGMPPEPPILGHLRRRFNEAPAISPGNNDATLSPSRSMTASMRPRRFRRGIASPASSRPGRAPRFNEAPAISPGNRRRPDRVAPRYGRFNEAPAISAGESARAPVRQHDEEIASMRPRRFRRGMRSRPCGSGGWRRASMRPRRFRRGMWPPRPVQLPPARFNEAPAISPGNARFPPGRAVRAGGFNEAPAISPGNPASESASARSTSALQ